jgi:hypothetical protein
MSSRLAQKIVPPRIHCPYCGDNFLLSHGKVVKSLGVICPNVKCGSHIRMNLVFDKPRSHASMLE